MFLRSRLLLVPFVILSLSLPLTATETVIHATGQTASAQQWDVVDILFHVGQPTDELADVKFSAKLEHEAGDSLEVPGFWNGGNDYMIRFTPPTSGNWNYVTKSSNSKLDGHRGMLSVRAAQAGRRGGLVVNEKTPRQFHFQNGDTYYPIAFECDWLFALDAENATDIPVTRKFVDSLSQYGFNQIVLNVFAYDVKWPKDAKLDAQFEYGSPKVFPFAGSNDDPDHSKLNVEYFKRLDRVIEYLDEKGIAAHLMIYVWNKRVNWPEANSPEDNRYFDYVVKRYQAFPNLIWDVSKEALGYGHNDVNYITSRIDRLRRLDAFHRLVTVHDYGYCRRFPDKLDFISVQLWSSELHSVMRKVCDDFPGKPILNIEHGGYETGPYEVFSGSYTSPKVCLERAYQCVFAGTYPTHYWQGAAWNVIFPDIDAMEPASRPRLDYYQHMRSFVDRYEVGRLTAGDNLCNSGFCLHNKKDLYIYYVPKENISIGVKLPKNLEGRMMSAVWFDPFSGTYSSPTVKKNANWPAFTKPEGDDFAILVVNVQPEGKK